MVGIRLLLTAIVALSLSASVASAGSESASIPEAGAPVPSLEPERTEADWRRLVETRTQRLRTNRAAAECRPLRAVFYAASDWLRLATKLAETASPCAEYYVSVPPLVADKTTFRREQASRIRALGPNFHALAEVHFTTWNRWVANTGSSWHTAGVTARQRMAEAGYDVSRGDSWALNELSTAVRRGDGNARANVREFIRGLYEGDGARPAKGAVLVVGFGQRTSDVSVYQSTLQSWLADTSFWSDLSTYVSDWSQEVYGDVRAHAVPGVPTSVRREYLNDYLQHKLVLASAGPVEIEPARAFLRDAYSPLANAAWPRDTAWGWTAVPVELMSAYVSAQVNALRHFSATTGQSRDHWGFAWAPRNTTGMSNADFVEQTGRIQSRIAAAIRDSGDVVEPENPGSGACGPPGQDTLCLGDLPEATHNEAWRSFRGWTQAVLRFATAPQSGSGGGRIGPDRARAPDELGGAGGDRPRARRHAPLVVAAGRVRDERRRAVDEHALGHGRSERRRDVPLPRDKGGCADGHGVGRGSDRRHVRGHGHGRPGRGGRGHTRRVDRARPRPAPVRRLGDGRLRERGRFGYHLARVARNARNDRSRARRLRDLHRRTRARHGEGRRERGWLPRKRSDDGAAGEPPDRVARPSRRARAGSALSSASSTAPADRSRTRC